MKTRPHIVTQTRVYDTAGLCRNADLLAVKMGSGASIKTVIGYSRVLIRIMRIILDLTLHNDCFIRRRDVLENPKLRKLVMERLGGAHALLRWRRQNTWNKARLAAIASGEYRPMPEPHIRLTAKREKPTAKRAKPKYSAGKTPAAIPAPANFGPAKFRLPALQNLRYVHRPRPRSIHRAKGEVRYPSVVLWPHELDGQYVPDFVNRARIPSGGAYAGHNAEAQPAGHSARRIFAPP